MAATGKTPILLYGSTTATNTPSAGNLTNSSDGCEIAINVADKNLFFKDSTNVVNTVPIRQSSTSSNGWLSSTDWNTFNGKAPAFTYTSGYIPYGQGTTTPTQSSSLTFNGVTLSTTSIATTSWVDFTTSATAGAGVRIRTPSGSGSAAILQFTNNPVTAQWATITSPAANVLSLNDGAGVSKLYIGSTGGVSIGNTTDPGASNLSVSGNVVIATSGKGIDFSATAGTGTSELLADYEEGTWTPTISSASGTCTFVSGSGVYTKIGRMVYVSVNISFSTNASVGTSNLTIGGLPYASTAPSSFALVSTDYSIVDYGTGGANGFVSIGGSGSSFVHQVRTVDISSRAAFSWSYSGYYQTT